MSNYRQVNWNECHLGQLESSWMTPWPACFNLTFSLFPYSCLCKDLQWFLIGTSRMEDGYHILLEYLLLARRAGGEELAALTTFPATHLIR